MMAQLLAHLWGDYILQSHGMALNKRSSDAVAYLHASIYTICFVPIVAFKHDPTNSPIALAAILMTHFAIDRFGLARYVVWAKNWMGSGNRRWSECSATGYPPDCPVWLSTWLLIVADNTLHLTCNYAALRWL